MHFEQLVLEADAHRDSGRQKQAAQCYARAVALQPERYDLRVQQGNMLKDSGSLEEAESVYRTILQHEPANADVLLQLARTVGMLGRKAEAERLLTRSLEANPASADAALELLKLGQCAVAPQMARQQKATTTLSLMALELSQLRSRIDALLKQLPDVASLAAFPIEQYAAFRQLHEVPAPPTSETAGDVVICLDGDLGPARAFHAVLDSLRSQSAANWRLLCVADQPDRRAAVERFALADERVIVVPRSEAGGQYLTESDCLLALDAGVFLHPYAVSWIRASVVALTEAGRNPSFFFDEEAGGFGAAGTFQPQRLLAFGGADFHAECAEVTAGTSIVLAADMAGPIALASVIDPVQRDKWRLEGLLSKQVAHLALPLGRRLETHEAEEFEIRSEVRKNAAAEVLAALRTPAVTPPAKLGVIIPTRDNAEYLERFIESLTETAALPDALQVLIVDNGSVSSEMQTCLERLVARRANVTALRIDEPFNWARLNNLAARHLDAEVLLFANDDMRMISGGWDQALRDAFSDPSIGVVGGKLIYPDETLQHVGVLAGWRNGVINEGFGRPADDPGPTRRWAVPHASAAVIGAFLATRRSVFDHVGGFDEVELPIAFSDTDFCLKARALGHIVLVTPQITAVHYEATSRGRDDRSNERQARYDAEEAVMRRRWGKGLTSDPSLHPIWHDGFEPFRLISAPQATRILEHLLSTTGAAWLPPA